MLEPLSNFKSTVRPRGMSITQVQTETRRVSSEWSFTGSSLSASVRSPGEVRSMCPAGSRPRLTFPPQWWCDKANVLSEGREEDAVFRHLLI